MTVVSITHFIFFLNMGMNIMSATKPVFKHNLADIATFYGQIECNHRTYDVWTHNEDGETIVTARGINCIMDKYQSGLLFELPLKFITSTHDYHPLGEARRLVKNSLQ